MLPRAWISTGESAEAIRAVSYNVLADKYSNIFRNHPSATESFKQCVDWSYREPNLLAEIKRYDPDVAFFQEVEETFFEGGLQSLGLKGIYLPRAGDVRGRVDQQPEGVALFYRPSLFDLVSSSAMYFKDTALPQSIPASSPLASDFVSKGEGFLTALLRHKPTGHLLLAACTHLFWNPSFPHLKVLQAAALSRHLLKDATQPDGSRVPVILGGDFNSLPVKFLPDQFDPRLPPSGCAVSGVYDLLVNGKAIDAAHGDHPANRGHPESGSLVIDPALPALASSSRVFLGHEPPLTTRTISGFAGTLDYVMYSTPGLRLTGYLQLPYDASVGPDPAKETTIKQLPSAEFSSDHLAVGASFSFILV